MGAAAGRVTLKCSTINCSQERVAIILGDSAGMAKGVCLEHLGDWFNSRLVKQLDKVYEELSGGYDGTKAFRDQGPETS